MNMGLGFSEVILIVVLVLVFFGSKELPMFIREAARWLAKARLYSDKLKKELNEISSSLDPVAVDKAGMTSSTSAKKEELRKTFLAARKSLSELDRADRSARIRKHLMSSRELDRAMAVMIYVSFGAEVDTRGIIEELLQKGKRVVVPYCSTGICDLGIGEIRDPERDLEPGQFGLLEPRQSLRDRFFRSDLQAIVCPGVGFDIYGGRLGRGKAYYDNFLRDLKGRVPIIGIAFGCQVSQEPLPFDYSDVPVDQVFTEDGPLLPLAATSDIAPESTPSPAVEGTGA